MSIQAKSGGVFEALIGVKEEGPRIFKVPFWAYPEWRIDFDRRI